MGAVGRDGQHVTCGERLPVWRDDSAALYAAHATDFVAPPGLVAALHVLLGHQLVAEALELFQAGGPLLYDRIVLG